MNTPPLSIKHLSAGYTAHHQDLAIEDVSFTLEAGSLTGLIGPNGAGKSTLIKAIVSELSPRPGSSIEIFGQPAARALGQLTYVPQRAQIDWDFPITVQEVVEQGRWASLGLLGRIKPHDRALVADAMRRLQIEHLASRQIGALSGGQQQRVFLARALAQQGQLYLLDEPLVGVDASTEAIILDLLAELRDQGRTILVVHHNLSNVAAIFDHLIILNRRVIACGPVKKVFTRTHLLDAYGPQLAILPEQHAP
jgi:manganese/zinc/iron transport system ATP- binding protein